MKKNRILNLIVFMLICSFLIGDLSKFASASEYSGKTIQITKKDLKNGKITIKNKNVKSIVINKNVKKATIQLTNVKVSKDIVFEQGNYTLKSSKSEIDCIQIAEKNSKIKLDQKANLNNRNLTIKAKDSVSGNLEFLNYKQKINLELGKKSDIKIKIGTQQKAEMVIKKADVTSKLSVTGTDSKAKLKKIVLEKPLSLSVEMKTELLQVKEGAKKAVIEINNMVDEVQNNYNAEIKDNTKKDEPKEDTENKKEDDKNTQNPPQNGNGNMPSIPQEGGGSGSSNGGSGGSSSSNGGGSSSSGSGSVSKKVESVKLSGNSEIDVDDATTEISVQYFPYDAGNKAVEWKVISGEENVKIISADYNKATIKALNNGSYILQAVVKNDSSILAEISGKVKNQKVSLAKDSMGIAGESEISGLEKGFGYMLESEEEYVAVEANGLALKGYKTKEEAIRSTGILAVDRIIHVDNGKVYKVVQINSDELLKKRYEIYMAIKKEELSILNYLEVQKLAGELIIEITGKEESSKDETKDEWKKRKEEIEKKEKSFNDKYEELKMVADKIIDELNSLYDKIGTYGKLELNEAKEILTQIDLKKKELSEDLIKIYIDHEKEERCEILKREIKEFEEVSNRHISIKLDEKGIVSIEPVFEDLEFCLIKAWEDNQYPVAQVILPEGSNQISMLQEMRKNGVAKYFVIGEKHFTYLKTFVVESNGQEVKKLENDLGLLKLDGRNFDVKEESSGKIRINLEEGTLEWDKIENADFYEVYADFTIGSVPGVIGKYYLNPTNLNDHEDVSNIENESSYSVLEVKDNKSVLGNGQNGKRILCARNLKEPKLDLKELVIVGKYYSSDWKDSLNDGMCISLSIVPRKLEGLYVSELQNMYDHTDALTGINVFMNNFFVSDYMSKILKVELPTK